MKTAHAIALSRSGNHPNVAHRDSLSLPERVSLWVAERIGTFQFFAACNALAILPLVFPTLLPQVQFVSSAYLQLVLLPLLLIKSNLDSRHSELRAEADYRVNQKAEREIKALRERLDEVMGAVQRLEEIVSDQSVPDAR